MERVSFAGPRGPMSSLAYKLGCEWGAALDQRLIPHGNDKIAVGVGIGVVVGGRP